jgi:hypothetical protein
MLVEPEAGGKTVNEKTAVGRHLQEYLPRGGNVWAGRRFGKSSAKATTEIQIEVIKGAATQYQQQRA